MDERILARERVEENRLAFAEAMQALIPEAFRKVAMDANTGEYVQVEARILWTVVADVEYDSYQTRTYEQRFSSHGEACIHAWMIATSVSECARTVIHVEGPADLLPSLDSKIIVTGKYFEQGRQFHDQYTNGCTVLDDHYENDIAVALAVA